MHFRIADFENGYSRNLLWRMWHASKALEMEHLNRMCTKVKIKLFMRGTQTFI